MHTITCTSTEVHGVQGSERFLFCTHWLNPLAEIQINGHQSKKIKWRENPQNMKGRR